MSQSSILSPGVDSGESLSTASRDTDVATIERFSPSETSFRPRGLCVTEIDDASAHPDPKRAPLTSLAPRIAVESPR